MKIIKNNWLAILLITFGTFLRVYQISDSAIFFGDSARDVMVAINSVEQGEIPLLGIPSSRPQFKQGPISIWIVMVLYKFFGMNLFAFSLVFSLIGIAAMIAVYEFCILFLNKKAGELTLSLLAFSPLAVAHSRMIFHTTPIPLFLVLALGALLRFWKKKPYGAFLASLSIAFLFQFELSLAPFLLLIPYVVWRTSRKINIKLFFEILSGLVLGQLPQIIFDISHNFQQIGGFIKWIIHETLMFFTPENISFLNKSSIFFNKYWLYLGRIWGTNISPLTVIMTIIMIISFLQIYKHFIKTKKLSTIKEIILVSTSILTLAYFISSTLSEAYFPPYFILLPLIISMGINTFSEKAQKSFLIFFIILGLFNTKKIFEHNFFVSNTQEFSYGPSVAEQKAVTNYIISESQERFIFKTSNINGRFPSYFDGYRYFALKKEVAENPNGQEFYIEKMGNYPTMSSKNFKKVIKKDFKSVTVHKLEEL